MQDKKIKEKMKLEEKISKEFENILLLKNILKGSVYSVKRKGGKNNSIIYQGYQLTYKSDKNITKTVYVKNNQINTAKKMISNYKKLKQNIEKIISLNQKLLKYL
jgi:hypothetical protein